MSDCQYLNASNEIDTNSVEKVSTTKQLLIETLIETKLIGIRKKVGWVWRSRIFFENWFFGSEKACSFGEFWVWISREIKFERFFGILSLSRFWCKREKQRIFDEYSSISAVFLVKSLMEEIERVKAEN